MISCHEKYFDERLNMATDSLILRKQEYENHQ
jgi:hypothetical protein